MPIAASSLEWDKKSTGVFAGSSASVSIIDPKGTQSDRTYNVAAAASTHWIAGKPLLSGTSTATLQSWDLATGRPIATFAGHTASIDVVRTGLRDGKHLATGSSDKTARIWDAKSGNSRCTFALAMTAPWPRSRGDRTDASQRAAAIRSLPRVFPAEGDTNARGIQRPDLPRRSRGGLVCAREPCWFGRAKRASSIFGISRPGRSPRRCRSKRRATSLKWPFSRRPAPGGCLRRRQYPDLPCPIGQIGHDLGEPAAPAASYYRLAWSNDGQQLLTAIHGSQLWDVKTSRHRTQLFHDIVPLLRGLVE